MGIFERSVIWIALAACLAPVWGTLLWECWEGAVRPRLIPRDMIDRAAAAILAEHGDRAEQMAWIAEDRAWRYSDSFKQGCWRRVRKRIAAMRREERYAATSRASPPLASISLRSQPGAASKPFGQVGAPSSRNTRAK
jgi:hypothetical protein